MFFRVLGTLVLEDAPGHGRVPIPGAKERLLLGRLLVAAGEPVSADRLAEDLWDARPPPTARKSLQAHLVRLRTALEPARRHGSPGMFIVRRGDGYALEVSPHDLDSGVALLRTAAGRSALAAGETGRARDLLLGAEHLWRGEPFADWADAAWTEPERHRLAALRCDLREARLDADLELGLHREAVPELEGLVVAQPLHEGWWLRLMSALERGGRGADALATARRARATITHELGVDAGPALRAAERALLADRT